MIRNYVVDELRSHRARITKVADLNRSWPQRKQAGPGVFGEALEIDSNVDLHVFDKSGDLSIVTTSDVDELIERTHHPCAHRAAIIWAKRHTDDLKTRPIMPFD